MGVGGGVGGGGGRGILDSPWSPDRLEARWFLEHNSSLL